MIKTTTTITLALLAGLASVSAQQYALFNVSGMHAFRGPVPSKALKMPTAFGRGFLVELQDVKCASDAACRGEAVRATKALDCDGHTFYRGLGLMGMVCFAPPSVSSREADAGLLATLRQALLPQQPASSSTKEDDAAVAGPTTVGIPKPSLNPSKPLTPGLFKGIDMDRAVRLVLPDLMASRGGANSNDTATIQQQQQGTDGDDDGDEPIISINSTLRTRPGNDHGRGPAPPLSDPAFVAATPYNWARDRLNQIPASLDQRTGVCASKGRGVRIYVLDTGCRTSHAEFRPCSGCAGTRATAESVRLSDGSRPYSSGADGNGHGTHTAGSAGGLNVGTAPLATVKCIKVLSNSGSGPMSYVIAGMDMVARAKQASPSTPMVTSLSLGSSYSSTANSAVSRLAVLGVVVVVAAGNEGQDAAYTSPASAPAALTVSASTTGDRRASWANYGSVVDIYAPGVDVLSASNQGDSYYARMSGTSMATPTAAGAVACVMGTSPSSACSSSDVFKSKLRNPQVAVYQTGGSKPLAYLADGSTVRCP